MEQSHWTCTKCNLECIEFSDCEIDARCHNEDDKEPVSCPSCQKMAKWIPQEWTHGYPRTHPVTFDYTFQVYRDDSGSTVKRELEWEMSCPDCSGPSTLEWTDVYTENYKCINCSHQFTIS